MGKWEKSGEASICLHLSDSYYISFNNGNKPSIFDYILLPPNNIGRPETAYVQLDDSKMFGARFLILYGDWRKEYEDAFAHGGNEACVALFLRNTEHMCEASDKPIEARTQ